MKTVIFSVLTLLIAVPTFLTAEVRTWTQESTGRKLQGEFVKMKDDKTAVLKIGGRETPVPLAMLIQADRDLIASLTAPAATTTDPAKPGAKPKVPEGETVVTLSGVALHCGDCVTNAEGAIRDEKYGLKDPDAVTVKADRKEKTIKITAKTGKDAQLAVNCISKFGFHGTSDHPSIKIAETKKGISKTTTMSVRNVNLTCGSCVREVKRILKSVDGVEDFELKEFPKGNSRFTVKGDYNPVEVMNALREKGYGGFYQ